jgi:hypothetical protein
MGVAIPPNLSKLRSAVDAYIRGREPLPDGTMFDSIELGAELSKSAELQPLGSRLCSALFGLHQHQKRAVRYAAEVNALQGFVDEADHAMAALVEAEESVRAVTDRFANRFKWKGRWITLRDYAVEALGFASKVAEVADYKKKVRELISRAGPTTDSSDAGQS